MEIFGEEGAQWCLVFFDIVEEIFTGGYEVGVLFVILMISRFLFEKFPEPFNKIQIGRVRWQKNERYFTKSFPRLFHLFAVTIPALSKIRSIILTWILGNQLSHESFH
jgi:hypothetical protein